MAEQAFVALIAELVHRDVDPRVIHAAVSAVADIRLGQSLSRDDLVVLSFAQQQGARITDLKIEPDGPLGVRVKFRKAAMPGMASDDGVLYTGRTLGAALDQHVPAPRQGEHFEIFVEEEVMPS
jgi:hypothetical protein